MIVPKIIGDYNDKIGIIDQQSDFQSNFVSDSSPVCVEMNLKFLDIFHDNLKWWQRVFDTKWKKARRVESFRRNAELIRKFDPVAYQTKFEL